MALAIRLARGGAKKRPFYSIVVADSRAARNGKFLEKIGTYNPMLPKDAANRVTLKEDRATYWLGVGAQPSERVAYFLGKAGLAAMPKQASNPQKSQPKKKAQERIAQGVEKERRAVEAAEKEKQAAADAAAAAAAKPAEPEPAPAVEEPAVEAAAPAETAADAAPVVEEPAAETAVADAVPNAATETTAEPAA